MIFGAILPHTMLFGGVKHYLELGNQWVARGARFILLSPDGIHPEWFTFLGETVTLDRIGEFDFDFLMTSEECFLPELLSARAKIIAFHVISKNKAIKEITSHKRIILMSNSTTTDKRIRKIGKVVPFPVICGINSDQYFPASQPIPSEPIIIMTYGRQSMKLKGTHLVKRACEDLYAEGYNIRMLLFDTPTDKDSEDEYRNYSSTCPFDFVVNHPAEKNYELYQRAHIFASAERKGGWANTAGEAMACGVAVVASKVGSEDFLIDGKTGVRVAVSAGSVKNGIKKLYNDSEFRNRVAKAGRRKIAQYQWKFAADHVWSLVNHPYPESVRASSWPYTINAISHFNTSQRDTRSESELEPALYIVNYHSIINKERMEEWERGYTEGVTSIENFTSHIEWLMSVATFVTFSDIPNLFTGGPLDKPYFAITFDDGFKNVQTNAAPVLSRFGITPAICVNSDFASGKTIFSYVRLAYYISTCGFKAISRELKNRFGIKSRKPKHLYNAIKNHDEYSDIIQFIDSYCTTLPSSQVHLSMKDLKELTSNGWEILNHTSDHSLLASLTVDEQNEKIMSCMKVLKENDIPVLPWLAVPFGSEEHVNLGTLNWLYDNPDYYCLFANSGINRNLNRLEVCRMGIGDASLAEFKAILKDSAQRTPRW